MAPKSSRKQYERELAAKRAEKKKKRSVTRERPDRYQKVSLADANKLRLELARKREAELHKDERTTPLNKEHNKRRQQRLRSIEMSAKTVEAAVQAACEALGVDRVTST